MDLAPLFADVDRIDWSQVEHAYGPARDVPGLLRALPAGDEEGEEAEQELWSSLLHQGSVYSATAVAAPFLAGLAVAGVRSASLLDMLGAAAGSTDECGTPRPGAVRAAVVAQVPTILPLLAYGDAEVRRFALYAVARCGSAAAPSAGAALRQRWTAESDPAVRADVLTACVQVTGEAAGDLCDAARSASQPPPVRTAALLARVETGRPWTAEHTAAVVALAPLRRYAAGDPWGRDPLPDLAVGLHAHGCVDAAIELVRAVLAQSVRALCAGDEDARPTVEEATWAADRLVLRSRSAPARLLPAMLPLLDDPATAGDVITALRDWAVPAPEAVPPLARLAEGADGSADRALEALVALGAPEATALLARHLADRPLALKSAFLRTVRRPPAPLPYDPALLDAVRARLAAVTAGTATPGDRAPSGPARTNEPVLLAGLLGSWGPAARSATPELVAALAHHPVAAGRALAAVADAEPHPEAMAALRARAGSGRLADRLRAATELHAMTGEAASLVAVLGQILDEPDGPQTHGLDALAPLGEQARPLLPRLLALLAEPTGSPATAPVLRARLAAGLAVRELTGDQDTLLAVVLESLTLTTSWWGDPTAAAAASAAALLGPAGRTAAPRLLPLLDRPGTAPAAARALVALDPGSDRPAGVPLTDLADRVLAACGRARTGTPRWPPWRRSPSWARPRSPRPSSPTWAGSPTATAASWARARTTNSCAATRSSAPQPASPWPKQPADRQGRARDAECCSLHLAGPGPATGHATARS
ncbi:hypothetical protein [Kitasatospora paracochleata]|uniref:HEAT repeat protein n=1 Tax=Kitasatospora paracochleata TaxID=58354 RepID=A0ABT1J1R3_9ACTN|nr:hypothetical protein [Kitasatospora paracochleata]MCP2311026.1 hypothetical protein [Kitasatospora paracochleata]